MPTSPYPVLPLRTRAELFAQLAQMEAAGLPPDRAFSVLNVASSAQPRLIKMRELIKRMDPATAGERSGLFTTLEARLVRASLTAGSPARIYQRLADVYTQRAMQVASMKSKMALPAFMFLAALLIGPLPGLVTGVYGLATYLWQVLRPILFIGAILIGIRWLVSRPTPVNSNNASPLLALPIAGKLIIRHNCRDFFESLALMLEAGVSMLDALPLALDTVTEASIKRDFAKIGPLVAAGATLSEALRDLKYLGSDTSRERAISFTHTGEQSGTLPEMLLRHVAFETSAINDSMEQLATWAPRIVYGFVAAWMAMSILSGPGIVPKMPDGI
jgi:general secretion pathway protein F